MKFKTESEKSKEWGRVADILRTRHRKSYKSFQKYMRLNENGSMFVKYIYATQYLYQKVMMALGENRLRELSK